MIAVKTADLTQDFKKIADKVLSGERVLVARPRNENLVMITEKEYNELEKLRAENEKQEIRKKAAADFADIMREMRAQSAKK